MSTGTRLKEQVRDFWEEGSCGEVYASGQSAEDYYESHSKARHSLEPYISDFAGFKEGRGKDVLEIGVGMGADHLEWAKSSPRSLTGVDITPKAIDHTTKRLTVYGYKSDLRVADAEQLPFDDDSFDIVYSYGVLHHSPDTRRCVSEVFRVLRANGIARIMVYHKHSLTGYMLWFRYGLLAGRPFRTLEDIYANHLESPGTKAFSPQEIMEMFKKFSRVTIKVQLSFGDLLEGAAGQRHQGLLLSLARTLWPRPLLRLLFRNHGLALLVEARK